MHYANEFFINAKVSSSASMALMMTDGRQGDREAGRQGGTGRGREGKTVGKGKWKGGKMLKRSSK